MEIEEPLKTGILFTPPQTFLRRSWTKRFCALYLASGFGIQRLEVFDSDAAFLKQSKSPSKIIALTDCVKVTPAPQKQQANVFEVRTTTSCHQFSADSFQEMTEWLSALQTVAFGVVRPSSCLGISSVAQNIKQEENLLYSSMDEPEVYSVKALNTDSMVRNNLCGDYKLIVTSVSISVTEDKFQNKVGRTIFTWPYRHIRRYGCSKDNFSFEAGRKCASGEGLFAFGTLDGSLIFQSVDAHVASLKSSQSDADAPASPFLDDEKNCNVFSFTEAVLISKDKSAVCEINSPISKIPILDKHSNQVESERTTVKPTISKPPRKSKQNPYTNVQFGENSQVFNSPKDSATSDNVYEEPPNHIQTIVSKFVENKHSEHEVEIKDSSLKRETNLDLSASYEPIYAVLEENSSKNCNWKVLTEELDHISIFDSKKCASNEKSLMRPHSEHDSDHYDHLSLKKFENPRTYTAVQTSDHIYGKLLPTKSNSATPDLQSENVYGALKTHNKNVTIKDNTNNINHSYVNVQASVAMSASTAQENAFESNDNEPKHFVRNNAEYAKILKSKK